MENYIELTMYISGGIMFVSACCLLVIVIFLALVDAIKSRNIITIFMIMVFVIFLVSFIYLKVKI